MSKAEIARFVITRAETEKNINSIVDAIIAYRNNDFDDTPFDSDFASVYGNLKKLEDTANTFINQLEYSQLIGRIDGESKIYILDSRKQEVINRLEKPCSLITRVAGEYEYFQRKYGLGPHHKRDDRKFSTLSNVSANQAEKSKVLLALSDILAFQPIKSISEDVLTKISEKTGVDSRSVERIISTLGVQPSYDVFEEKYLQLSMSGRAFATEFEQSTEGIFGIEGLGFISSWIGSKPNNPDVLAISNDKDGEYLGILDSKAYKQYSIDGNHQRVMTQVYIPKYSNFTYNGKKIEIAYFSLCCGWI